MYLNKHNIGYTVDIFVKEKYLKDKTVRCLSLWWLKAVFVYNAFEHKKEIRNNRGKCCRKKKWLNRICMVFISLFYKAKYLALFCCMAQKQPFLFIEQHFWQAFTIFFFAWHIKKSPWTNWISALPLNVWAKLWCPHDSITIGNRFQFGLFIIDMAI